MSSKLCNSSIFTLSQLFYEAAIYVISIETTLSFVFLLFMLCPCLSHFGKEEHTHWLRYSPSGSSLKEWQFLTQLFELLICTVSTVRGHGKCNFNSQLQHLRNCLSLCVWRQYIWAVVWALIITFCLINYNKFSLLAGNGAYNQRTDCSTVIFFNSKSNCTKTFIDISNTHIKKNMLSSNGLLNHKVQPQVLF